VRADTEDKANKIMAVVGFDNLSAPQAEVVDARFWSKEKTAWHKPCPG
jgi:hypothetical protein